MAKGSDGHSDGGNKPSFDRGSFAGVGSFSPKPGLDVKQGSYSGNCGRDHTLEGERKIEWPGDKAFEHGADGDRDKDD